MLARLCHATAAASALGILMTSCAPTPTAQHNVQQVTDQLNTWVQQNSEQIILAGSGTALQLEWSADPGGTTYKASLYLVCSDHAASGSIQVNESTYAVECPSTGSLELVGEDILITEDTIRVSTANFDQGTALAFALTANEDEAQ